MSRHYFKMLFFSLCALLAAPAVAAGVLSADDARGVAADFFRAGNELRLSEPSSLVLAHTAANSAGEPTYYVFNATDGRGFIIVAADDKVSPVIGYSYDGVYETGNVPPTAAAMLSTVAEEIATAPARASRRILARAATSARKELNTPLWRQEAPFNNLIPGRRLVGCVGVALATIMKHHNHPAQGRGSVGEVDFNVAYDWENMRTDNYRNGYSDTEATAVATLVSHAAQAILTDFGMSSSSAFEVRVPAALINNFGYDAGVSYKKRSEMSKEDWERVLVAEIDADRPVLYSGQDVSAGHAFVCDGYEKRGASTYFHINWGWGGLANSYFASDALNPQASHNYQFNDQTTIVYNIKPAEASAEWSPIHLTSDERQIGITTGVADLTPGMEFTVRAGNFKNIMFETFSGSVAVALFDAAGGFKTLLSAPQGLTLGSLNLLPRGYADFACVVPADAVVSDGDNVRMVTRAGAEGAWLPVAGDMLTRAQVPAKGNDVPYCTISMPAAVDGAEISADGNRVVTGRDYSFTVSAASADKVVTVKANGFILTPGAGNVYRLQNVLADQEIQIFAQNAADVVSKRSLWVSAGTLSSLVSDEDAGTIKELTLYGTVDVNDFTFMRERMKLEALDLSAVTVVANGANPANAIPAKAFRNCWAMKRLVLPRNITTLKNGCFELAGLRSIEIPASVSTYEYNLFLNCSDLTEVVVRRKSPAWVNWCVFAGTPKARLVVPVGSKNAYASKENWQDFREIVEEDAAPVTSCTVALQDAAGVKITPLAEGIEFAPGTPFSFTVETDDTFGDATMEVYANSTRLSADASGVYTVTVNENTFIHTRFNQPQPTLYDSPWRITSSQGGVGMCTDVVNVVAGKNFSIRVNALAIPADNALMYYAAVLTDAKGAIKEFISPVISNSGSNYGDLPCTFNCVVKEASVREGNLVRVATSYNKKNWALVKGADGSVADSIAALGNRVVYHSVTMPDEIAGATIEGAATQVVRGMPFSCKVTAVEYSDVVAVFVNGKLVGSDKNVINVRIGAVTEDLDIAVQVNQKGAESYLVLNVQEGELDAKLSENCPARLKLVGTIHTSEFAALQKHASTIQALDLADLKIKGNGDLADAIPSQAFAPAGMTLPALKSVVLPTSLRNIEANAFYRCTGITEIAIPSSVGYIGNGAMSSCVNLKKIVAQGTVPPRLGNMTPFPANAANITLEVPKGAENAYKAAEYWNALGLTTAKVYYNIQVDPTRCCQYNSSRPLDKIDVDQITSVDIMLPTFKWGLYHKENPVYRPGIAFKLYDNGVDKTSTMEALDWSDPFCNGGHYLVRFGSVPVNHRLDIEFYYAINLNSPEGAALSFVGLDEANVWKDVPMALFVENSTATPTLYKEGADYRFRVECSNAAMQPKVRIRNRVMSKYGATQEFTETEAIALPDENGVYTIENLRGDATVTVTMVPSDGAVLNGSEIAAVDAEDAADMTVLGVSGVLSDNDYAAIRENFTSVETLDLSEMENAEIPDGAFENMENLSSVVVPDNVTAIGENAFAGCSNLESVTLGAVDAIGANAFNGCENLTSITINSNGGNAAAFRRAPRLNGIDAASFAGINPNCIIFVADENISINDVKNVVYSGSGTRHALTDILLSAEYPFHTPGSFNLGDRSISLSVPVKCRQSTVSDNWSGIVLPFTPSDVTVDGVNYSIAATGANTLSMMTFADSDAEELSHADAVEPNVPYVVRVNDMGDAPVTALFSATGAVAESADEVPTAFDVPRTPESAELARGGKLFTIYGNYLPREAAEGEYVIDATGEIFELVDPEAETIPSVAPFGVVLRANAAGAPASLKIGTDESSAIVAVAAVEADGLGISREGGIMVITSDRARKLAIFDLSGRCVASLWLEAGRNTVELQSGIYLVAGLKIRM